jgi:hypothetical protein
VSLKPWDSYWLFWLLIAFLVPELLAVFKVIPLDTFSGTTRISEKIHPWLQPIVFAFGVGLLTHLAYGTNFFKAMLGGAVVALGVHFLRGN